MFRPVDPARLREELGWMQRLNEELGVPRIGDYFRRILNDGWITRNPEIYHLYEEEKRLRGYAGLIPIFEASYHSFLGGERFPFQHIRPQDMLTAVEYSRARLEGVWIWIESFLAVDAAVREKLGEYVYGYLAELNLKGLLVSSSSPVGEADCRWLGMRMLREDEPCPTGIRKLWYADESITTPSPDQPFGPPTPARCLFLTVRERFGQPPRSLGLSPRERQVARMFYLEDRKVEAVASHLNISPGTVKAHLQRIRDKAEPVVGSRNERQIATYLHRHLGETTQGES